MKRSTRVTRLLVCFVLVMMVFIQSIPALAVSGSTSLATSGKKYVVTASALNFRSGPGTQYAPITVLKRGATVTYLSQKNGWWRVRTSSGSTGYVDRQFLTQETTKKTGKYFTTSNLRVRKSPSTSSRTLQVLSRGTMVSISKLNGDWGYSSSLGGWVALSYLSTSTVSASSSGTSSNVTSGVYVVTASSLNVRDRASTRGNRKTSLPRGTEVRVSKTDGDWGYIAYSEGGQMKNGWVSLDYLKAK